MGALLKVLLILFGIYFIGRALMRGLVHWFIGDVKKNLNTDMNDRLRRQQEDILRQKKKQEGHITINYHPPASKNFAKEQGDYVDFEEVK